MRFSYFVDEQCLLDNINLNLVPQRTSLITGIANVNLNLLNGIVAKFFPLTTQVTIQPQIQALLSLYSGQLQMHTGSFPQKTIYIGPDPEKHLFFATVNEEMITSFSAEVQNDFIAILQSLGLDESFLVRRIASLSGGEKMKVALAIALAQPADCYMLQGVIPWLDRNGRKHLWQQLKTLLARGAHIVFCENEIEEILPLADEIFYFDGLTLAKDSAISIKQKLNVDIDSSIFHRNTIVQSSSAKLLEFADVCLLKHPHYSVARTTNLLDKISFTLFAGRNYLMFGNNGAGKSTITQIIFRLVKADSGSINLLDNDIKNYNRQQLKQNICYVSQNPMQQLIFSALGEYRQELLQEQNTLALDLFNEYFDDLPNEYPLTKLTFLQYKILTLLNFVNQRTRLIILDEPTWGIDHLGRAALLTLLDKLAQRLDFTLLVISHDLTLAKSLDTEIFYLENGKLTHFNNVDEWKNLHVSAQPIDF